MRSARLHDSWRRAPLLRAISARGAPVVALDLRLWGQVSLVCKRVVDRFAQVVRGFVTGAFVARSDVMALALPAPGHEPHRDPVTEECAGCADRGGPVHGGRQALSGSSCAFRRDFPLTRRVSALWDYVLTSLIMSFILGILAILLPARGPRNVGDLGRPGARRRAAVDLQPNAEDPATSKEDDDGMRRAAVSPGTGDALQPCRPFGEHCPPLGAQGYRDTRFRAILG